MALVKIVIASILLACVVAEPPSPYHYQKPQPVPALIPSGSYGVPSFQAAASFNPAPLISAPQPVHIPSTSYGFPQAPIPAPSFSAPAVIQKPASSYGAPSNGLFGQSTNQNAVVSNLIGDAQLSGQFDGELKSTIEAILLKEESRAASEVYEGNKLVAITMDGPKPAINVAQFVLPGHAESHHQHHVHVPAPVYGPSY